MTPIAQEITEMIDMLPATEQNLALEIIRRLVLAWDPDFTKVTPTEAADIAAAEEEFARGEFVRHEDIKWD